MEGIESSVAGFGIRASCAAGIRIGHAPHGINQAGCGNEVPILNRAAQRCLHRLGCARARFAGVPQAWNNRRTGRALAASFGRIVDHESGGARRTFSRATLTCTLGLQCYE
jgi:hypothetical protein